VYYFSAYAVWQPRKVGRHIAYVKALRAVGVTVVLGQFKQKDRRCPACNHTWVGHEEKETDVNIAIRDVPVDVEIGGQALPALSR
jgi:hypothetical protein